MLDRRLFVLSTLALGACGPRSEESNSLSGNAMGINLATADQDARIIPWGEEPIDYASLSEEDWQARLTTEQFRILRREGTERAGTSPLNDEERNGTYVCAGCSLPLFTSETKYESGTGWPSFWEPIDGAVATKPDNRLWTPRTEYHCARCEGHQGHVFNDGPRPSGQRWCNNGVALEFVPADNA